VEPSTTPSSSLSIPVSRFKVGRKKVNGRVDSTGGQFLEEVKKGWWGELGKLESAE
jgi:hypothetical protein